VRIPAQQRFKLRNNGEQIIAEHSLWQDGPDQSPDHCRDYHSGHQTKKGINDRLRTASLFTVFNSWTELHLNRRPLRSTGRQLALGGDHPPEALHRRQCGSPVIIGLQSGFSGG
jgi:hypothetical protein